MAPQSGFGFGGDALDAQDLEIEGAAEIVEGVVRGHQHASFRRHGGQALGGIGIQFVHVRQMALGAGGIGNCAVRIDLAERVAHRQTTERQRPGSIQICGSNRFA